jgi:hypothetical protein
MIHMTDRRDIIQLLAGAALSAVEIGRVFAANPSADKATRIKHLIEQARGVPDVSQRIDFISQALLGVRYQANTLIGGPKRRERFVVRDDAFDCVTFCEVVLAAAIARDFDGFEVVLRRIRYNRGIVQYSQRNHYFAEWGRRNIENRICRPVAIGPSVTIEKTVSWHRELGKRHVSISAVAKLTLLNGIALLRPGDIIGFVSRRPDLDFFHTGVIAFGENGVLLLRHASRRRGRVAEEKMTRFLAVNSVKYVMLLRAEEPRAEYR